MSCSGAGCFRDGVKFDDTHAHVRTGSTGSWVYRVLFSSLQECPLLGLASPPAHTHRRMFVASRFKYSLLVCDTFPCLPRSMLCLDVVNEVNPGPDRVGHEISNEMNRCTTPSKTMTPPSTTRPLATRNPLSGPPNCIPRTCFSLVNANNRSMIWSSLSAASRVKTAIGSPLGSSFAPVLRFEA